MSTKAAGLDILKQGTKFLPGGGALQDIIKAAQEPTATEMMGRYLGFKRGRK
jgi:hypothetical protein